MFRFYMGRLEVFKREMMWNYHNSYLEIRKNEKSYEQILLNGHENVGGTTAANFRHINWSKYCIKFIFGKFKMKLKNFTVT